jgi:hypothetical protein
MKEGEMNLGLNASTGDMSDFTQVLLIPKGYRSGFGQPIPEDYEDPTRGGLLAAGIGLDPNIDRTYVTLPAGGVVRVFGDRTGGWVKPFHAASEIFVGSGP